MLLPWRDVRFQTLDGQELVINTSLTWRETRTLAALAADRSCLEVGSAYGYSAIIMGQRAASVVAVDPHRELQGSLSMMKANIAEAEMGEKIEIQTQTSRQALPFLLGRGARYDLVFIDGDHHLSEVSFDLDYGWRLLKPGGSLAVHDYREDTCVDVLPAVEEFYKTTRPRRTRIVDTLWIATR